MRRDKTNEDKVMRCKCVLFLITNIERSCDAVESVKCLKVRVDGDELDPRHPSLNHPHHRIPSSSSHTDNFYDTGWDCTARIIWRRHCNHSRVHCEKKRRGDNHWHEIFMIHNTLSLKAVTVTIVFTCNFLTSSSESNRFYIHADKRRKEMDGSLLHYTTLNHTKLCDQLVINHHKPAAFCDSTISTIIVAE